MIIVCYKKNHTRVIKQAYNRKSHFWEIICFQETQNFGMTPDFLTSEIFLYQILHLYSLMIVFENFELPKSPPKKVKNGT